MNSDILFERDMLYPTDNENEPGSIHLQIMSPDNTRIPLFIEARSSHSPLKYIDTVINLLQSDIFDRIFINIKKIVDIYIKINPETDNEYSGYSHVKVYFSDGKLVNEGVNL